MNNSDYLSHETFADFIKKDTIRLVKVFNESDYLGQEIVITKKICLSTSREIFKNNYISMKDEILREKWKLQETMGQLVCSEVEAIHSRGSIAGEILIMRSIFHKRKDKNE